MALFHVNRILSPLPQPSAAWRASRPLTSCTRRFPNWETAADFFATGTSTGHDRLRGNAFHFPFSPRAGCLGGLTTAAAVQSSIPCSFHHKCFQWFTIIQNTFFPSPIKNIKKGKNSFLVFFARFQCAKHFYNVFNQFF